MKPLFLVYRFANAWKQAVKALACRLAGLALLVFVLCVTLIRD